MIGQHAAILLWPGGVAPRCRWVRVQRAPASSPRPFRCIRTSASGHLLLCVLNFCGSPCKVQCARSMGPHLRISSVQQCRRRRRPMPVVVKCRRATRAQLHSFSAAIAVSSWIIPALRGSGGRRVQPHTRVAFKAARQQRCGCCCQASNCGAGALGPTRPPPHLSRAPGRAWEPPRLPLAAPS